MNARVGSVSGFTLLETLLALTALVLSGLAGALRHAVLVRERTAGSAERVAAVREVLLRLTTELEGATAAFEPASPERFVVATPERSAASSELRFATLDGTMLAYGVRDGRFVRAAASRFAPPTAAVDAAPVLAAVLAFRVRCFDGAEWRATWLRPGLPRAVEVVLEMDDGRGGREELGTTVVLPASEA